MITHYVDGRDIGAGGPSFENINPGNGEKLDDVALADAATVDWAVGSSQQGFDEWRRWSGAERGAVLRRAAELLRSHEPLLAFADCFDTGRPIKELQGGDTLRGAAALDYFAGVAPTLAGSHVDFGQSWAYTRREPLGVCAGIGPWNYPLQIACWKSAVALACGNSMIFKPAEYTPTTALMLARTYTEAGLPAGVFNVVQGGPEVGALLVAHPGIRKVSLTGETTTGQNVMREAALTLKHVSFELGGKSPLIVFPDADLDQAVTAAIVGNFYSAGEICTNGTRVYLHESIHGEFVKLLLDRTAKLRVGDPSDPDTDIGALISKEHQDKVLRAILNGEREGARLIAGGSPLIRKGFYVTPTIFDDVTDAMTLSKVEIFGPVMSLLTFDREDDVVKRANDSNYGLAAGIFTKDLRRAHRVAAELQAGLIWLNTFNVMRVELPFGGYKLSGLGRENGLAAVEDYTQLKTVYVEQNGIADPY